MRSPAESSAAVQDAEENEAHQRQRREPSENAADVPPELPPLLLVKGPDDLPQKDILRNGGGGPGALRFRRLRLAPEEAPHLEAQGVRQGLQQSDIRESHARLP